MKKSLLILAAAFTFSSFFTSCRDTERTEEVEVSDDFDNTGEEIERAAEDVGDEIEEGVNEVEQEIDDDNQ